MTGAKFLILSIVLVTFTLSIVQCSSSSIITAEQTGENSAPKKEIHQSILGLIVRRMFLNFKRFTDFKAKSRLVMYNGRVYSVPADATRNHLFLG